MSKDLKRSESRISHSWLWDSHICPQSSKWMAETLDAMDQSVKRMLKLIEGDGDSFAKKAQMYYQKRPELISHVEDFYRLYRSLAERYNNLTGELRKNVPELQSQSSGISDSGSVPPSPPTSRRSTRRKNAPRALGFDVFLGSVEKNVQDSSPLSSDSEMESDETSSVNNHSVTSMNGDSELQRLVIQLEIELRETEEDNKNYSNSKTVDQNKGSDKLLRIVAGYEEQLKTSNEKLKLAEEEIATLKNELENEASMKLSVSDHVQAQLESAQKDIQMVEADTNSFDLQEQIAEWEASKSPPSLDFASLIEMLKTTNKRLLHAEDEVAELKLELENNNNNNNNNNNKRSSDSDLTDDAISYMPELVSEKSQEQDFFERFKELKEEVVTRDHEIEELEQKLKEVEEELSQTTQNSSAEKNTLQEEISTLTEERALLEAKLREWESRGQSVQEEIKQLKEGIAEIGDEVKALNKEHDALKLRYDTMESEREELDAKVAKLSAELDCRDEKIHKMYGHLKRLHIEQVQLIKELERGRKVTKELEEEVEKQRLAISSGAEEKREAIRQLCFSLDHYRDGYKHLRQVFIENKQQSQLPVLMAS